MKFKNRKQLKIEDGEVRGIVSLSILPADFIIYAPPFQAVPLADTKSSSTSRSRSESSKPSPEFESSMALTIFVLLTALFFMGFFTVYLRCVASGRRSRRAANSISNSRLQQLAAASSLSYSNNNPAASKEDRGGLDPTIIGSLPILPYNCKYNMMNSNSTSCTSNGSGGLKCLELEDAGRRGIGENNNKNKSRVVVLVDKDDCVVCLCEYEEGEMVKMIPYCGHLFHPECIDLWFISHSSCPLCRSTQLFPPSPTTTSTPEKKKKKKQQQQQQQEDDELKSTVVILRRACSFSSIGDGCCNSNRIINSSSSLLLGDKERRLVMFKRSSSWSYSL